MTDQAKLASRPWRRFLRFSVRGLIVLVLVIGCWLGWLVRSARIQREAVSAISKAGGSVDYNWEWSKGGRIVGGKPWAPKRLVDLVGVDFFGHVRGVFYFRRASDLIDAKAKAAVALARIEFQATLARTGLPELEPEDYRTLGRTHGKHVTSTQLPELPAPGIREPNTFTADLKALTQLSLVNLAFTDVIDDGLAPLKGLTNLSDLSLSGPFHN